MRNLLTFVAVALVTALTVALVAPPLIDWSARREMVARAIAVRIGTPVEIDGPVTLPASNVSIVLVSKLHLPTLRALAYARATNPARLEAITVDVDEAETLRLTQEWERAGMPLPLTVVSSTLLEVAPVVLGSSAKMLVTTVLGV